MDTKTKFMIVVIVCSCFLHVNSYSQSSPPILFLPVNGSTNVSLTPSLEWLPVTGAATYGVQVSKHSNFDTLAVNQTGLLNPSYNVPPGILFNNTLYYWRANASNLQGTSQWSVVWNFTTLLAVPAAPFLISPPNGSVVTPTPFFDWSNVPNASVYRLQIAYDQMFLAIAFDSLTTVDSLQIPPPGFTIMGMYYWHVRALNPGGSGPYSMSFSFYVMPDGVKSTGGEIPEKFTLYQNYPNPFNPVTKIKFDIPLSRGVSAGRGVLVHIIIYDVLGREIAALVNEKLDPGTYEVEWNASNYPSGVYFYRLIADNYTETKKMVLLK